MGGWGFIFDANARLKENNNALQSRKNSRFEDHKTPYTKNRFQILQKKELSEQQLKKIKDKIRSEQRKQRVRLFLVICLAVVVLWLIYCWLPFQL